MIFLPFPFSGRDGDFHLSNSGRYPPGLYIRKYIFTRHFKAPVAMVTGVILALHFLKWLYQLNFHQEGRSYEHFSFSKYAFCLLACFAFALSPLAHSLSLPHTLPDLSVSLSLMSLPLHLSFSYCSIPPPFSLSSFYFT